MRLPRVRFTVRRLMILVAALGIILALVKRRESFLEQAMSHELSGRVLLGALRNAEALEKAGIPRIEHESFRGADQLREIVSYHEKMWVKYGRAARYPWLPVAPDPPYPE